MSYPLENWIREMLVRRGSQANDKSYDWLSNKINVCSFHWMERENILLVTWCAFFISLTESWWCFELQVMNKKWAFLHGIYKFQIKSNHFSPQSVQSRDLCRLSGGKILAFTGRHILLWYLYVERTTKPQEKTYDQDYVARRVRCGILLSCTGRVKQFTTLLIHTYDCTDHLVRLMNQMTFFYLKKTMC